MTRTIAALLLAAFAVAGCASLPDSIKGPFAHTGSTSSDVVADQPEQGPYPKQYQFGG